jgi:hypothetical protein
MDLSEVGRQLMGKAGRQYIEANYSLTRVVDMWEAMYKELLLHKGYRRR